MPEVCEQSSKDTEEKCNLSDSANSDIEIDLTPKKKQVSSVSKSTCASIKRKTRGKKVSYHILKFDHLILSRHILINILKLVVKYKM